MPKVLNAQQTANAYTDANTVQNVYESKGGWIVLAGQVFAQQQKSEGAQQGSESFGEEFLLPAGAHYLEPGTIGLRVRNATAGLPVLFTICLFYKYDNAMVLGGTGISTPGTGVGSLNFQHNDLAVATEPTADFEDESHGNNLVWTIVDDPANTRVKITPVWQNPTIFPFPISTGPASSTFNGAQTQGIILSGGTQTAFEGNIGNTVIQWGLTTESNPRFTALASGALNWGPGNTAVDLTVARLVTGGVTTFSLTSTGTVGITTGAVPNAFGSLGWAQWSSVQETIGGASGNNAFVSAVQNDTQFRFLIQIGGTVSWGPGNAVADLSIARIVNLPTGTGTFLELTSGSGFGYGTGTGGTVTQLTSLTTGVTINKPSGTISLFNAAFPAGVVGNFIVTNSVVGADDSIILTWQTIVQSGILATVINVAAGSFTVNLWNLGALSGAQVNKLNFDVIKGANA